MHVHLFYYIATETQKECDICCCCTVLSARLTLKLANEWKRVFHDVFVKL